MDSVLDLNTNNLYKIRVSGSSQWIFRDNPIYRI